VLPLWVSIRLGLG